MKYIQDFGYKVIPVNPFAEGGIINGEKVISSLENIKQKIDIVDVFRPSKRPLALPIKLLGLSQSSLASIWYRKRGSKKKC